MKRALTIGVDERRGVVLERLGGTIDVQGVLEELNAFAFHIGEDEAKAVLLDGVECHGSLLSG